MTALPRWLMLGLVLGFAVFTVVFGMVVLVVKPHTLWSAVGLALFVVAAVICLPLRRFDGLSLHRASVVTLLGLLVPALGMVALDPTAESFSTGAWYVSGVVCLVVELLLHRRPRFAWAVLGGLVVENLFWAGPSGLLRFGIVATVLVVGVVTVAAWAINATSTEVARYSAAAREAMKWRAAQDAFHSERQVRLTNTAVVAAPMLRRLVEAEGGFTEADRDGCRLLEQTIRDEIRGRRLLNPAVREQVMAHRRRGAIVQVNDDGGLDDLDPSTLEPLLARVAAAIAGLTSDRIIIRTAPSDSPKALSVVAMSSDPVATALGLDDGDDQVDLWLELDRPGTGGAGTPTVPGLGSGRPGVGAPAPARPLVHSRSPRPRKEPARVHDAGC